MFEYYRASNFFLSPASYEPPEKSEVTTDFQVLPWGRSLAELIYARDFLMHIISTQKQSRYIYYPDQIPQSLMGFLNKIGHSTLFVGCDIDKEIKTYISLFVEDVDRQNKVHGLRAIGAVADRSNLVSFYLKEELPVIGTNLSHLRTVKILQDLDVSDEACMIQDDRKVYVREDSIFKRLMVKQSLRQDQSPVILNSATESNHRFPSHIASVDKSLLPLIG